AAQRRTCPIAAYRSASRPRRRPVRRRRVRTRDRPPPGARTGLALGSTLLPQRVARKPTAAVHLEGEHSGLHAWIVVHHCDGLFDGPGEDPDPADIGAIGSRQYRREHTVVT